MFGLDLRSLALFRIALGLLILYDLFIRAGDMAAFYTDAGVLSRADSIRLTGAESYFSIHWMAGGVFGQSILFSIAGLLACMLILGWYTRLVTFASWFMLLSLQNRNSMVLQSGDTLFLGMLLWGFFMPLGARFSIDSVRNSLPRRTDNAWVGVASVGLLVQMALLYTFASLGKDPKIWTSGYAIHLAGHLDAMAKPMMLWMKDQTALHAPAGFLVLYAERYGWILAFIPVFTQRFRAIAVVGFILMHIGFGLGLAVGIFAWAGITLWLAIIPGCVWDWAFKKLQTPERLGLKAYYDGDCMFCRQTGLLLKTFFLLPETIFKPCQSDPDIHKLMQEEETWVLETHDGRRFIRFDALIEACRASPLLFWLAPMLAMEPVRALGNRAYRWVSANRYRLAPRVAFLSPRPMEIRVGVVSSVAAGVLLVYIVLLNLAMIDPYAWDRFMDKKVLRQPDVIDVTGIQTPLWRKPSNIIRVQQNWAVFSPYPSAQDGWYVIMAELRDGQEIDLWNDGEPVYFGKPDRVWETFRNDRWSKYLEMIRGKVHEPHLRLMARYWCRKFNRENPENPARAISVFWVREITYPDEEGPPEPRLLRKQFCISEVD
jgi:predicted DCC family thiol-disulfide oxidoreductase YuxK